MENLINILYKWQTLTGAIIGGIFALLVALLVAYKAKRQEDIVAAMLIVANLVKVKTASNVLDKLAKSENISDEDLPEWYSEKLVRNKLQLSPLFEAYRIRLMPVCVHLAVHLEIFQMSFNASEIILDRLSKDYLALDMNSSQIRKIEIFKSDSKALYSEFNQAVLHASCAEKIVTNKIISNFKLLHSIQNKFLPTEEDQICVSMLKR